MSSRPSSSIGAPAAVTPTVPSAIHVLAAPTPLLIDAQLPNYLVPASIALLTKSAAHVVRQRLAKEDELREAGLIPSGPSGSGTSVINGRVGATGKGKEREDEIRVMVDDEVAARLERMGQMVGGYVAEKLTLARPPLASHLDIIKFICKDLFLFVYSKQIDNLRTNHRSHAFPPLFSISSSRGPTADLEAARLSLIQGALTRLGMPATVTAESSGLPQCTFQIRAVKTGLPPTPSASTPNLATAGGARPQPVSLASAASTATIACTAQQPANSSPGARGTTGAGLGIAGAPTA